MLLPTWHSMIPRFLRSDLIATVIVELAGPALDADIPARLIVTIALDVATLSSPTELSSLLWRQCIVQRCPVPFMLGPRMDLLGRLYAPLRLRNGFMRISGTCALVCDTSRLSACGSC